MLFSNDVVEKILEQSLNSEYEHFHQILNGLPVRSQEGFPGEQKLPGCFSAFEDQLSLAIASNSASLEEYRAYVEATEKMCASEVKNGHSFTFGG